MTPPLEHVLGAAAASLETKDTIRIVSASKAQAEHRPKKADSSPDDAPNRT